MYSQRPWMPGMRTIGAPWPWRTMRTSISQGFPGLQRVLNPLECFPLTAQLQERLAFQIEQVLFRHGRAMRQRSAGEHLCQRLPDDGVVVADAAGTPCKMNAELESS